MMDMLAVQLVFQDIISKVRSGEIPDRFGWYKHGGLTLQWGTVCAEHLTFPMAFSNCARYVIIFDKQYLTTDITKEGFKALPVYCDGYTGELYFAIGY
jgi:hypothetical protein